MPKRKSKENLMWTEIKKGIKVSVLTGLSSHNLPKHGWIQPCYFCRTPTMKVDIFTYEQKNYYTYECNSCYNSRKKI